jgi:hypothetical protein
MLFLKGDLPNTGKNEGKKGDPDRTDIFVKAVPGKSKKDTSQKAPPQQKRTGPEPIQLYNSKSEKVKDWFREKKEKVTQKSSKIESNAHISKPSIFAKIASMPALPNAETPSISLYILLLVLGGVSLLAKWFFDYDPIISFTVSFFVFLFFFVGVLRTPLRQVKLMAVAIMGLIDLFVLFGLRYSPATPLVEFLITFHVYGWLALALAFFLVGVFEIFGAGKHLGRFGWFIFIAIIVIILLLLLPLVWSTPALLQEGTHAEYFDIANEKLSGLSVQAQLGAITAGDIMSCYLDFAFSPGVSKDQVECRNKKRIERFCRGENPNNQKAYDDCILTQSESNQQVTSKDLVAFDRITAEFKVNERYFPEKTKNPRESYLANLEYKDFPEGREALISCFFDPDKFQSDNVTGTVGSSNPLLLAGGDDSLAVNCQPNQELEPGTYKLYFEATFTSIETKTTRTRFFVLGGDSYERDVAEVRKIEGGTFATALKALEKKEIDLAVATFGIGNDPDEPIVRLDRPVQAGIGISNKGGGELLAVHSLTIEGPESVRGQCFMNNNIQLTNIQRRTKKFGLKTCPVTVAESETSYDSLANYEDTTFTATLVYDYKITHTEVIEIEGVEIEGIPQS